MNFRKLNRGQKSKERTLKQLIENFAALGTRRLVLMGGTAIGIVAAGFIAVSATMAPQYRAVATDLTASEASHMMDALQKGGFAPRVSDDGSVLSLPEQDLGRGRMALAEAGLPSADKAGWEIFRESNGIGMNSFMQRVNKMVAMEGALERTIEGMDSVAQADVHLAPGERETFSQERTETRASVMIQPRRGSAFTRRQAVAVRNLIAGGVPDISPDNITVMTASGETVLGGGESEQEPGLAGTKAAIEDRVARNIETILAAHVGAQNVRVKVAADIATEREVIVKESFDPDQQVARSTSSLTEQSQGRDAGSGNVDVANNLPGVENGGGAGGGSEESRSKSLDETVFEIGNTRSEKIIEPGSIERLTVAVVVNGRTEDGAYAERTPEELERLTALVRGAAGIDAERGDEVAVESLRFADPFGEIDAPQESGWSDLLAKNSGTLIRGALALLALAMILLLGVRPALARMRDDGTSADPIAAADQEDAGAPSADQEMSTQPIKPEGTAVGGAGAAIEGETGDGEYVSLASVSGDVMRRYITELSGIVEGNRDDAVRVLRNWIHQKG